MMMARKKPERDFNSVSLGLPHVACHNTCRSCRTGSLAQVGVCVEREEVINGPGVPELENYILQNSNEWERMQYISHMMPEMMSMFDCKT